MVVLLIHPPIVPGAAAVMESEAVEVLELEQPPVGEARWPRA